MFNLFSGIFVTQVTTQRMAVRNHVFDKNFPELLHVLAVMRSIN